MEYQALYRRWRPLTFDDVVGQDHVTQTIKSEVASGNVGHAFLFCGSRGTGKTSTARILSRAINCISPKDGNPCNECDSCKGILSGSVMDVIEIDAASNSGVENIRSLREEASFAAAAVKYKVYIIDEVHALSKEAFNALLKLLEEPPAHVKFVLATTEANKVLDTISSRCQRFDFKKITKEDISRRLDEICDAEMIEIAPDAIDAVAAAADGSLRDALTILEPCISKGKSVDTDYVMELLGIGTRDEAYAFCAAIAQNDAAKALNIIDKVCSSGKNLSPFVEEVIKSLRNIMIYSITSQKPPGEREADWISLLPAAELFSVDKAVYAVNTLSEAHSKSRYMTTPRFLIEAAVVKLCNIREESSLAALRARIGELEKKIALGIVSSAPPALKVADGTVGKPEKSEAKRPEAPKAEVKTENADIQKIKGKWPEIMEKLASSGRLNLYTALVNSALRPFGEKVAIVFPDAGGETFRSMIENDMDSIAEIVLEETGLNIKLVAKFESDFENVKKEKEKDPFDEIASFKFPGTEK